MSHEEDPWDEVYTAERDAPPALGGEASARLLAAVRRRMVSGPALDERGPETAEGPASVMTPEEVAKYLRVTPEELREEMSGMPFFEFAGRLRMRREALDEWVQAREQRNRREKLLAVGDD